MWDGSESVTNELMTFLLSDGALSDRFAVDLQPFTDRLPSVYWSGRDASLGAVSWLPNATTVRVSAVSAGGIASSCSG
jgi:hypothetical protein